MAKKKVKKEDPVFFWVAEVHGNLSGNCDAKSVAAADAEIRAQLLADGFVVDNLEVKKG